MKLMLEFCDLAADRGRRHVEPLRRNPDCARMRGLAEMTQCGEIHGAFPIQNGCCNPGNRVVLRLIWHHHLFGSISPLATATQSTEECLCLSCTCCPIRA